MMGKVFISTVFLLVILLHSAVSVDAEVVIFGPKQYNKPKGRPVTYTDTFQAEPARSYRLWVENGTSGESEVKNVSVSINGVEIITSKELREQNPVTAPVTLQSSNTLTVTLKGQGGNFIIVKVICEDCPVVPEISIETPRNGQMINGRYTMVKGKVESAT